MPAQTLTRALRLSALVVLTLLIGAFHGFVGWHKAFSPYSVLVQHSAWTVHLPMWLGRLVGWTELALTGVLLTALIRPSLAKLGARACIAFIALEIVAAMTHYVTHDGGSLGQNALSITLTATLAWLFLRRQRR